MQDGSSRRTWALGFFSGMGIMAVSAIVVALSGGIGNDEDAADTGLASSMDLERGLGAHAEIVRPAAIHTVARATGGEVRTFPGTVMPARSSGLAFRISGPLVDLAVREGDIVEAGALLAVVDPRDYAIAVARLKASLQAAEAASRLAQLDHERSVELRARGAAPEAAVDRTSAERDQALAEVASLRQQLKAAEAALSDTRLTAPFRGRVARLHVEAFDFVTAGEVAITLHDVAGAEFVVFIPERQLARLDDVREVHFELADRPGYWRPAHVHEIASDESADTAAFRTTLRQTDLNGTAPLAGISGVGRLVFATDGDAIKVATSAVFSRSDGRTFVWRVEAGAPARVRAHEVEVAGIEGERVRITRGLGPGDRIVAYGVDFLMEGQAVRPMGQGTPMAENSW